MQALQAGATYFKNMIIYGEGSFSCKYLLILIFHQDPPSYSHEFAGGRKVNIMVVVAALPMQPRVTSLEQLSVAEFSGE